MKRYLLPAILFIAMAAVAQKRDTIYQPIDVEKLKRQVDSSTQMLDTLFDNQLKQMQEREMERTMEQNNRNLESFMQMQKEREAKQKRSNWIRLGVGVLFLGVLIFGIMRRKKMAREQNAK